MISKVTLYTSLFISSFTEGFYNERIIEEVSDYQTGIKKSLENLIYRSEVQQNSQPIFKAKFDLDRKYVKWGEKPAEETEDSPGDTWTWPHGMCEGPERGNLKASSTLNPQGNANYSVENISDDDPRTAWVEGNVDYGKGEFLEFQDWFILGYGEISILNGYQSSKTVWENNSRVKKLQVSINGRDECIVELGDVMGIQTFNLPATLIALKNGESVKLRFTIIETYPGIKWKDTAISGIFTCGG
jgi:hypothetical protein